MFLYNVSIIMEDSVHTDLLESIQQHIQAKPEIGIKLLKMLDSPHEGQTYCLQVMMDNQEEIAQFQAEVMQDIQALIGTHYPDKAFLFDSTMQYINQA